MSYPYAELISNNIKILQSHPFTNFNLLLFLEAFKNPELNSGLTASKELLVFSVELSLLVWIFRFLVFVTNSLIEAIVFSCVSCVNRPQQSAFWQRHRVEILPWIVCLGFNFNNSHLDFRSMFFSYFCFHFPFTFPKFSMYLSWFTLAIKYAILSSRLGNWCKIRIICMMLSV